MGNTLKGQWNRALGYKYKALGLLQIADAELPKWGPAQSQLSPLWQYPREACIFAERNHATPSPPHQREPSINCCYPSPAHVYEQLVASKGGVREVPHSTAA